MPGKLLTGAAKHKDFVQKNRFIMAAPRTPEDTMTNKTALITGASAGLGSEFARQLAARNINLVLVARREEPMQALANELTRAHGVTVDVLQADLSDAHAPATVFEETRARGIAIDYLVNNAGSEGPDLMRDRDWPACRQYLELMMMSVVAMCHYFIPPMQERGFGRVINVASVAGLITVTGDYTYGPTKSYIVALSRGLSSALRDDGVFVSALCPGFTHTDFHASEKLTRMKQATPGFIWYDADVVVREGLTALEKGRDVHTSGRLYRILVPLLRSPFSRRIVSALGVKL